MIPIKILTRTSSSLSILVIDTEETVFMLLPNLSNSDFIQKDFFTPSNKLEKPLTIRYSVEPTRSKTEITSVEGLIDLTAK